MKELNKAVKEKMQEALDEFDGDAAAFHAWVANKIIPNIPKGYPVLVKKWAKEVAPCHK